MIAAPPSATAPQPGSSFRPLGASGKVWFCLDACLDLRPARSACTLCRDACPAQAFAWKPEGVSLDARCTGCGLCAAACPDGAIRVSGFGPARFASAVQRIECARVPEQIATGAATVPCLGGIPATTLVGLTASCAQPWQVVDRGWCGDCRLGNGTDAIAGRAVETAGDLLASLGVPQARWPSIVHEPLPPRSAHPVSAAADPGSVDRRGFLSSLARPPHQPAAQRAPVAAGHGARLASPVIRQHRRRFAEAVQALADEAGGTVPASVFPVLSLAAPCGYCGVCAALCPSGALASYADDANGIAGLQFDGRMCVACGLCARECPSEALRLLPGGNRDDVARGPHRLTSHTQSTCPECDGAFVAPASGGVCPRCRTDRALSLSLFGTKLAQGVATDRISHARHFPSCSSEDESHEP